MDFQQGTAADLRAVLSGRRDTAAGVASGILAALADPGAGDGLSAPEVVEAEAEAGAEGIVRSDRREYLSYE